MRFFRGSHFVLVGWHNMDFCFFYHGIGSTYPTVTHSGRGRNSNIYQDVPAGGPEAPSDKNFKSKNERGPPSFA